MAVAVSELGASETIIYANLEFERLSGLEYKTIVGMGWQSLNGDAQPPTESRSLAEAIVAGGDYLGVFTLPEAGADQLVDVWSNVIEDDEGNPAFRLVALVAAGASVPSVHEQLEEQIRVKDTQLLELQHRVKNNLQMITALIRAEARGIPDRPSAASFSRLAGRVEALGILYRALDSSPTRGVIDLGIYLSEIASAVMRAHAEEGIHLDLQVDTWMVSLDVAMPTGLVINELLTNALKHAFKGRAGGTITLHCTTDDTGGCHVLVADDGVGLPEDFSWPQPGKLSALIVRSLLQNADGAMSVRSVPGAGVTVSITFRCADAARVG